MSAKTGRRTFTLLAVTGAFAIFSSTLSKTPVLPLFARHLGASADEIGWVVMASTVPGILISLPAGMLSDYTNRRRLLMAALFVFASAPFLYLPVARVWELVGVRFYHGFATAIFGTVATAVIADRYTENRAEMLSLYTSSTIVGRSIAPFLGGALISLVGYHGVFIACAASGICALMLGTRLPRELETSVRREPRPSPLSAFHFALAGVLRNRMILITGITEAVQYFVFGAVETFLAVYAAATGSSAWMIGVILGIQLVSIVLAKPLLGQISDRIGRKPIILIGLVIGASSVALLPLFTQPLALTTLSLGFGIGFAGVTSSTTALVADLSRSDRLGTSMGALLMIMDIGQAAGPAATGAIIGARGYATGFETLALLLILTALWFAVRVPAKP